MALSTSNMKHTEYYFLLSQDHPELSYIEMLNMLGMIGGEYFLFHVEPGLAVARLSFPIEDLSDITLAYIKEVGVPLYMGLFKNGFTPYTAIRSLKGFFKCRSKIDLKIYSLGRRRTNCDYALIIDEILRNQKEMFSKDSEEVRNVNNRSECPDRLSIVVGNIVVIGYPIATRMKYVEDVEDKRYMRKEDIAFMANICRYLCGKEKTILDLFCGYGYILDELCARTSPRVVVGSDIDVKKTVVSKRMVKRQCIFDPVVADAMHPAFRRECADAIISDLPYGRRSRVYSSETLKLPILFLNRAMDLLREGSIVILAISLDQFRLLKNFIRENPHYRMIFFSTQYVHGSLSRVYIALRLIQK